jgi:beta-glucosidase
MPKMVTRTTPRILSLVAMLSIASACRHAPDSTVDATFTELPPCAVASPAQTPVAEKRWTPAPATEAEIAEAVAGMTLAEKIGQMVQTDIAFATPEDVREHMIGSIISTVPDGTLGSTAAWRNLFDTYQREALQTRTGIPLAFGIDAAHGHAYYDGNAVILPHNIGLGATRNPELARLLARVTARELSATGIRWTFAPTIAVARDIRWGRTYEAFGEDVELQKMFAAAMVEGYQGADAAADDAVGATAKHFIADGATDGGVDRGNATISDAELRSMHLPGFLEAIDAGVVSIMASFSSVNGEKVHESRALLTDLLKTELGFDGVVITDWEGIRMADLTLKQGLEAGFDMFMLVQSWREGLPEMIALVENGEIPMSRIDDSITRILRMKLRLGLFEKPLSSDACGSVMGSSQHRRLARRAVRESLVLLKNESDVLPLSKDNTVIVAGSHADNVAYQSGGWTKKWQGAHKDLFGHAERRVDGATSILDGIKRTIGDDKVIDASDGSFQEGSDTVIIVVGETPYAEGVGDRAAEELVLDEQQRGLIAAYHKAGKDVITVLISGRPLLVNEQLDQSDAFVAAWLPGSEGQGVADVLFGDYKFTGKLSFSWPRNVSQIPINVGDPGYDPLFAYGFGLTY